jgi:ethanolamine ammonia-lyase large subunit
VGVLCTKDGRRNPQSTIFHAPPAGRKLFHRRPAPEFLEWLQTAGIFRGAEPALLDASARRQLMQGLESSLREIA